MLLRNRLQKLLCERHPLLSRIPSWLEMKLDRLVEEEMARKKTKTELLAEELAAKGFVNEAYLVIFVFCFWTNFFWLF